MRTTSTTHATTTALPKNTGNGISRGSELLIGRTGALWTTTVSVDIPESRRTIHRMDEYATHSWTFVRRCSFQTKVLTSEKMSSVGRVERLRQLPWQTEAAMRRVGRRTGARGLFCPGLQQLDAKVREGCRPLIKVATRRARCGCAIRELECGATPLFLSSLGGGRSTSDLHIAWGLRSLTDAQGSTLRFSLHPIRYHADEPKPTRS
jgi:hypothetical protein